MLTVSERTTGSRCFDLSTFWATSLTLSEAYAVSAMESYLELTWQSTWSPVGSGLLHFDQV